MESTTTDKPRQTTRQRVIWFLVGAVVNYLLISTPLKYLTREYPSLPDWGKNALSLAVSTSLFFVWNYFVNFRTDVRKRDAFPRYVAAVLIIYAISTALLTAFKLVDAGLKLRLGKFPIDLDIVTLQLCLGWVKFIVYHKWIFPAAK